MLSFLSPRFLASSYAKIAGWTLVAAVILFPFFVLQAVDQNGQLSLAPMTYRPYVLAVLGVFLGLCGHWCARAHRHSRSGRWRTASD